MTTTITQNKTKLFIVAGIVDWLSSESAMKLKEATTIKKIFFILS